MQDSMREIMSFGTEWRGELFPPLLGSRWLFLIKTDGRPREYRFFADGLEEAVDLASHLLLLEMSWGN